MKYLCMVIIDEKKLHAMSESEAQALDDESLEHDDVVRKRGHFLAAQALESVSSLPLYGFGAGKCPGLLQCEPRRAPGAKWRRRPSRSRAPSQKPAGSGAEDR